MIEGPEWSDKYKENSDREFEALQCPRRSEIKHGLFIRLGLWVNFCDIGYCCDFQGFATCNEGQSLVQELKAKIGRRLSKTSVNGAASQSLESTPCICRHPFRMAKCFKSCSNSGFTAWCGQLQVEAKIWARLSRRLPANQGSSARLQHGQWPAICEFRLSRDPVSLEWCRRLGCSLQWQTTVQSMWWLAACLDSSSLTAGAN